MALFFIEKKNKDYVRIILTLSSFRKPNLSVNTLRKVSELNNPAILPHKPYGLYYQATKLNIKHLFAAINLNMVKAKYI